MSTDRKLRALRETWKEAAASERFDFFTKHLAESPIEGLFTATLLVDAKAMPLSEAFHAMSFAEVLGPLNALGITGSAQIFWALSDPEQNTGYWVLLQPVIDLPGRKARLDYAFVGGAGTTFAELPVRVAVELDGHDFHERTKAQAQRDKSRDRLLTAQGWTPIRFTGSEVYRDPSGALREVFHVCDRILGGTP